jgi:propanol-preferring alcohol dehydrogenase
LSIESKQNLLNRPATDARVFLQIAAEIDLRPRVTAFPLEQANEALQALKNDSIDRAAVITP